MISSGCIVERHGPRGRVWRVKYRDATGRQIMRTVARERDGGTRSDAERELHAISAGDNPVGPLLRHCERLILESRRIHGDTFPHLEVAHEHLKRLYEIAQEEIAQNPRIFAVEVAR